MFYYVIIIASIRTIEYISKCEMIYKCLRINKSDNTNTRMQSTTIDIRKGERACSHADILPTIVVPASLAYPVDTRGTAYVPVFCRVSLFFLFCFVFCFVLFFVFFVFLFVYLTSRLHSLVAFVWLSCFV